MKRFLLHLALFCGLMCLVLSMLLAVSCFWVGNQNQHNFQASLVDKVQRLKSIEEPKILLVGNSNVTFGFRSNLIEDAFGMPVVNLGLHGGLGNRFHENIAKLNIREGDLVVLCHSDYSDDGKISDTMLELMTLQWYRELWEIPDPRDYFDLIKAAPKQMFKAFLLKLTGEGSEIPTDCYSRAAFNEYGDNVFADTDPTTFQFTEGSLDAFIPTIREECIDQINRLNQYVAEKGATLLIAGFPIADGEFTPDRTVYRQFEQELRARVECPVISSVDDYFFDYEYFYNTVLHLTGEGAVLRTNQLIADLKDYLAGSGVLAGRE